MHCTYGLEERLHFMQDRTQVPVQTGGTLLQDCHGSCAQAVCEAGGTANRAFTPRKVDALRSKCSSNCLLSSTVPFRVLFKGVSKYSVFAVLSCTACLAKSGTLKFH